MNWNKSTPIFLLRFLLIQVSNFCGYSLGSQATKASACFMSPTPFQYPFDPLIFSNGKTVHQTVHEILFYFIETWWQVSDHFYVWTHEK